jgi:AcrR family transcriptional regulator
MATTQKRVDRRVERTRHILQQAFREVVQEKGFAATSIQDITERANLNRGTFYLHFADKYTLLDTFVREDIQHLLVRTLPPASRWNSSTLRLLIETLLTYFERKYQHQPHIPQAVAPLVERAVHEELTKLLLVWLKESGDKETRWQVPIETIARVVGWSIFGPVLQWSQEETTTSVEQMTDDILTVITEGLARLASHALPA